MEIKKAYLFAKQITAGEVPPATPFYWRYTPPGYIDGQAPYLGDTDSRWYLDSRIMARGLGQSSIASATDDLGTGATKIDDPTIYPSSDTNDYNYTIPLYDDTTGDLTDYELRIGLRYKPTQGSKYDSKFGFKIMLYRGAERLGSITAGIRYSYLSNATKDFEYYLFGGAGRMWISQNTPFTYIEDALYICTAIKCKDNNDNVEIAYAVNGVDLAVLRDTYNVVVSSDYFRGNNDNPDYPPT